MTQFVYALFITLILSMGALTSHADDSYISDMAEENSAAQGEVQEAMDDADLQAAEDTDEVEAGADDTMDAIGDVGDESIP